MRCFSFFALGSLMVLGCGTSSPDLDLPPVDLSEPEVAVVDDHGHDHEHHSFALTSENTQVLFVGAKKSGDSHPGGFKKVEGKILIGGDAIEALEVTIDVDSLVSDVERLTGHLKSEDFFSVQEFPEMKFVSTSISGSDEVTITGNLTLHGQTQEISFPAKVNVDGENVELESEFKVDRTKFGMDYTGQGDNPINADVEIKVIVGQGGLDESQFTAASQ